MEEKPYHHGNLKNELLEQGLRYVSEYGAESLSMRKLATVCGVSSAAPYAHFRNKEDYLIKARDYVAERFAERLTGCIESCKEPKRLLIELGKCYVMFFVEKPHYHRFLFLKSGVRAEDHPPYRIFSEAVRRSFAPLGSSDDDIRRKTVAMWAMVQGLADIYTVYGSQGSNGDIEKDIEDILCALRF